MPADRKPWGDLFEWHFPVLLVAAERYVPVWRPAGVPPRLREAPSRLQAIGQRAWPQLIDATRLPSGGDEARISPLVRTDRRTARALRETLREISAEFGVVAAREFYSWARRVWVDADQRLRWSTWYWLLRDLAMGRRRPRLGPEALDRSRAIAARRFREEAADEQAIEAARAAPATAFEQAARAKEPAPRLADEQSWFELLQDSLGSAAERQRAWEIWRELAATLSAAERDALNEWATAEVKRTGSDPARVAVPAKARAPREPW